MSTRASMYRLIAQAYRFPRADRTRGFCAGDLQANIEAWGRDLCFSFPHLGSLILDVSPDEFEVEFISLHEVGMGGAPCPLHSGHYQRDRMKTMEEVLRFYRFFDYAPDRSADLFPDHLGFELEFMAHLDDCHARAVAGNDDELGPLLAQRDFIQRNLCSWVSKFRSLVEERSTINFSKAMALLLDNFIQFDSSELELRVGSLQALEQGR